jgi:hypothetical protein
MAGMTKAQREDLEALRADLGALRGSVDFHSQAHLPPLAGHVVRLDDALARVNRVLGEEGEAEEPEDTGTTQVATVPPGSAGGAAANPETGANTVVPFSAPLAAGDTSSIPGTPGYDPAAQAEVERDAAQRQHAAERTDTGGGATTDAAVAHGDAAPSDDGDVVELREPAVPGLSEAQRDALAKAGFRTAADIRSASDEQLLEVDGIGPSTVTKLRESTRE